MKPIALLVLAGLTFGGPLYAQETKPADVRTWSARGKTLEAMIVGVDADGKAILLPYKPVKVAPDALSEQDRAFLKAWQEQHAKDQGILNKARMDALEGIKPLHDNLSKVRDGKLEKYPIAKPENLRVVAYYFTKKTDELIDSFLKQLSDTYERLRKRTDVFEVVYVPLDDTEEAMVDYFKEGRYELPTMDFILSRREPLFRTLFKGTYPQLVVVDASGKVLADSMANKQSTTDDRSAVLKVLEETVREARRAIGDEATE